MMDAALMSGLLMASSGEFQLSFLAGEWQDIETPIFKRTVVQKPIVIHEPPFSYDMALAEQETDDHLLTITLNPELIKPETVLLQGKIYYPNNEEQMFSMDAKPSQTRQLTIKNYDWGRYSVELSVFGSNINDREFMATLPTYKFEIDRPIEVVPEIVRPEIDLEAQAEQQRILEEEQRASTMLMITLIVVGNLTVLLLGWLAIRVFVQKKPLKFKFSLIFKEKNQTSNDEQAACEKVGKNGSKNDKSGEILNLSMQMTKKPVKKQKPLTTRGDSYYSRRCQETLSATKCGVVVQLVRIPACHAWGRGFESRPLRQFSTICKYAEW